MTELDQLQKKIGNIIEHEPLAAHTTFKIGGPAKYFFVAKNNADLTTALQAAFALQIKTFVLGGGSNLLVSDQGFDGLVIKLENRNFKIDGATVFVEAGASVEDILKATLKAGLIGWAWAAGLPGTIGGAIHGNAGAYGLAMSNIVTEVELFTDGQVKKFTNDQMKFSYRSSITKEIPSVILSATLQLKPGDTKEDEVLVKKYIEHRVNTQPLDLPNCGCVFKNVDLQKNPVDEARVIRELDISEDEYRQATKYHKLPVSFIIDHLNLKGKTMGGAQVSEKHGAFIVNVGNARAEQVIMLMSDLKMRVRNKLGIQLEEEIQMVGF